MPAAQSTTLHAAALQDHFSRLLKMPGRLALPPGAAPTLAQRLRLVAGPVNLSPVEWEAVRGRALARGDSRLDCAICLQPFRDQAQVLLSCSHVFHAQCLRSFERYTQARCCPLCRCQAYQKRRIEDGRREFEQQCAARIQAVWRGWRARKEFSALRKLVPPQHPGLRRRWVADKLQCSTDRLVGKLEQDSGDIGALFAELDAAKRQSQAIYSQLEARRPGSDSAAVAVAAHASPEQPAAAVLSAADSQPARGGDASVNTAASTGCTDWEAVIAAALDRDDDPECPICLVPLCQPLPASGGGGGGGDITLLSCSHAFHGDCLALFEAFQVASEAAPRCPCCRAQYARIQL